MDNEKFIWDKLIAAGMNPCGVAGLMGNLYAESGLIPTNLQNSYEKKLGYTDATYTAAVDSGAYLNFATDSAGYGLAQWTYSTRKAALLAFAKAAGKSVGDLEMQLDFLVKEMGESFKAVLAALKTAATVREASDAVLLNYERPADQSAAIQEKRAAYGKVYYDKYAATTTTGGTSMATKITSGKELAAAALNVAKNYKTLYVMGCFGAPMTAANKTRYINNGASNGYNAKAERKAMINAASADTFGFDCVCLIKGLLWGWCGDASKSYGGATYPTAAMFAAGAVPDIGADSMIAVCKDVSTNFSRIEVGEAVWLSGHIGIYIGDGLAVECTPTWQNQVQVTACNCDKSGYKRRDWTKHGKLPYVTYGDATESAAPTTSTTAAGTAYAVGDVVNFIGSTHYTSSAAASGVACKPGAAKVTAIAAGAKHPYHLIREAGGGSTVYGWVDASDIVGRTDNPVAVACAKLTSLGVINSPDYWITAAASGKVAYLDLLITKAAEKIAKTGPRTSTPEEGIEALVAAGIVNTPEYWAAHYGDISSLGALLCALGGAVK